MLHFFSHIGLSVKELLKAPWHNGEALSLKEPKSTLYQLWESGLLYLFGPWFRHLNQRGSNLQLRDYCEEECGRHPAQNNCWVSSQTSKTSQLPSLGPSPLLPLTPQSMAMGLSL